MKEDVYGNFRESAQHYPLRPALQFKRKGKYVTISYRELLSYVDSVASSTQQLGIKKGDKVGIFSCNRPEWVIADLAILKLGGVVVPIYTILPKSYVKYVIQDTGMEHIFVENAQCLEIITSMKDDIPQLKTVLLFDDTNVTNDQKYVALSEMKQTPSVVQIPSAVTGNDIATIVYTSGTTGEPKGTMLTHTNIVSNAWAAKRRFGANTHDIFMSFLPLCHMFERTCGYYAVLFSGASIGYAESLSTIADDVLEIRPTLIIAVPRIFEKVYERIEQKIAEGSVILRILVSAAIKDLNKLANLRYKKLPIPLILRIRCCFHRQVIAAKFRKLCGGRLRLCVSGGASLDRSIAKVMYIFGFNIVEGYGLTEASPVVCSNTLEHNKLGTVGTPLDGVEVKIGENDEIIIRGPNVMKGYYNKPEETKTVIDQDGWLHSGDQGRFDDEGNLVITGRIKEIIITSYGENIAPAHIEGEILKSKFIDQVVIYGDKRKRIVALIVPDRFSIEQYARKKAIATDDYPRLLQSDEIKELLSEELDRVNEIVASFERVRTFALLPESFTVENGMLTPMQKLRRGYIAEKYKDLIESLYAGDA